MDDLRTPTQTPPDAPRLPALANIHAGLKNDEPGAPLAILVSFQLPNGSVGQSMMEFPIGAAPDEVAGRLQGLAMSIHLAARQLEVTKVAVPETGVLVP